MSLRSNLKSFPLDEKNAILRGMFAGDLHRQGIRSMVST